MANIVKKYYSDFDNITEYYNFLVNKTKNRQYVLCNLVQFHMKQRNSAEE